MRTCLHWAGPFCVGGKTAQKSVADWVREWPSVLYSVTRAQSSTSYPKSHQVICEDDSSVSRPHFFPRGAQTHWKTLGDIRECRYHNIPLAAFDSFSRLLAQNFPVLHSETYPPVMSTYINRWLERSSVHRVYN